MKTTLEQFEEHVGSGHTLLLTRNGKADGRSLRWKSLGKRIALQLDRELDEWVREEMQRTGRTYKSILEDGIRTLRGS